MANEKLKKSYIPFQCMIISHVNRFRVEGMPAAQYDILEIISAQGDKTANELAGLRRVSQSGISKLTRVLLEKGYIEQNRSRTDRRFYLISITPKGKDFLKCSEEFRSEVLTRIENALSDDEITQFAYLCDKIVEFDG